MTGRGCEWQGKHLDELRVTKILCQIILALKECHGHSGGAGDARGAKGDRRPILHRDLKPANVRGARLRFLADKPVSERARDPSPCDQVLLDGAGNVKLGDFGLAKELSSASRLAQTNLGTPYYMAPEIVNEKQYDERADIWCETRARAIVGSCPAHFVCALIQQGGRLHHLRGRSARAAVRGAQPARARPEDHDRARAAAAEAIFLGSFHDCAVDA